MTPESVNTWVEFFREAGGWGLAVVEGFVVVFLWRKLEAKDERLFQVLDKTNEILLTIQGKQSGRLPPPGGGAP